MRLSGREQMLTGWFPSSSGEQAPAPRVSRIPTNEAVSSQRYGGRLNIVSEDSNLYQGGTVF